MKKISRKSFLKLASAAAMSGITAGALAACNAASGSTAASSAAAKYTPGTYTATAKGMSDITMTATFSETAITDIQLDLSGETDSIGQAAKDDLIKQLLEAQNSTIDGVSGATITSDAVKQCMNDCITQAMGGTAVSAPEASEQAASWRTAPEAIPDSEITKTYDVDVAIIGMGYAGLSCYRELAEEGKNVLVLEAMPRESWWTVGHDIGHINSDYLLSHGVPKVDEVEFVNNWMMQTHGKANTALVMKFAKNSGSTVDWWLDKINPDTLAKTRIQFWPDNEYTVHQLNNGMHYYTGTLEWWENYWENPASGEKNNNTAGQLELKDLSWDNYNYVEENFSDNATALFGTKGVQLVMDGAKVTGVIAQDSDGNYLKINAKNGVVLAGGGFGGNKEMMDDLLPDIKRLFTKDEDFFAPFGRDGSTIQMGVWAGGRLEGDISTMNFDSMAVPDYLPGPHYYTGTLEWWENYWENPASGEKNNNTAGQLELKDLSWDNYNYVEENFSDNATALFGTKGVQLVMDGAKVTGVIAQDSDGNYLKINAKNGVVLAGGGFGGNKEMMDDLLPDIKRLFTKDEDFFAPFGRDGSTIQMGVWAGGRLEGDISTMNFDSMAVPDYLPGPLWVDENGQRFQNEAFAGPEINGFFMARAKRGNITSIYDSTYETQILRGFPGHQAFEYDMPAVVEAMKGNFEAAKAAGAEGANGWYCADTIEQLAEYIGVEPAALSATVEQYNKVCAEGYDSDFAKDPHFLNAVAKAPFYAHVTTPSLGFALVTTGGFVTTNDQQVLNEDYQPIEGLYASGNTCGMRFGPEYITPIPGVSIGMCLTLGRELGKYLAAK